MTLTRSNAVGPEVQAMIKKIADDHLQRKVLKTFYTEGHVDGFFDGMLRVQRPETMKAFSQYHSEERVMTLMETIWPPPSLCEMWNAWDRKGRPGVN